MERWTWWVRAERSDWTRRRRSRESSRSSTLDGLKSSLLVAVVRDLEEVRGYLWLDTSLNGFFTDDFPLTGMLIGAGMMPLFNLQRMAWLLFEIVSVGGILKWLFVVKSNVLQIRQWNGPTHSPYWPIN